MTVKSHQNLYTGQRPARVTTPGGSGHLDDVASNTLG
jgi:hypothetical protein